MTISYNWLADYIDIPETPEELAAILTGTGLEVESVERFETLKGGLAGLVVGEVLSCTKHPNADKLSLTTVNIGRESPLSIVCGAANVAAGQKVIVALPGTTLYPFKGEPFIIKPTKIRGEQSEGMICAEDEIGLSDNHDGIIVLEKDAAVGAPASAIFKICSDHRIEIGLTPNRADAASHLGVARDIKAAKKREIRQPSVDEFKPDSNKLPVQVEVINTKACLRYSAVTLAGITVGESPDWLKNRLLAIGQTPINNVVDITNYVLHETGQPLHAFDVDAIAGRKVIVQTLPEGTPFVTLDKKERKLTSADLMICNGNGEGMCIAGVFGGVKSGITASTKNVFLESACFSADFVRKTVMHHGLKTDASFRFERGTDPDMTVYALKRAALLLKEITGGEIASQVVDIYPQKIENRKIELKDKNINRLIGKSIPRHEVVDILKRLDISVESTQTDRFTVSVPPYRVDVYQEADVIEEVLRIYGFNQVELKLTVGSDFIAEFPANDPNKYKRVIGELLTGNGFYEIWTNSLTNPGYQQKHNLVFNGQPVEILNKLSEEQGILRQSLLFTGLEVCAYNINRKQKDLKLFEFGKVYHKEGSRYFEEERLGLFITGNSETENWQNKPREIVYHDIAQFVNQVIQKSGVVGIQQEIVDDQFFEYGSKLSTKNALIGKLGMVKSAFLKDFGIKQSVFYAELDSALLFNAANPKLVAREVPKFPEVRRDLSLVLDKSVRFDEVRKLVVATEKQLLKDLVAFDVYEGKNIPEGKKAYALGFILQDDSKTLTDQEIDTTMNRLMAVLEKQLGAVIRK
ncbi:phenylalanine--tRNA ligase subunit beta [Oscillatoria amoena NRMC-F 0135]|nr:phenylalanine--tRNA ligase subunit beta [Oscillatoria amoena NRMC-F 0135]